MKQGKIIFITGGVLSSLGKGIIASSVARLFKDQGLNINMMKCDPYLNVDPGTMSPIEHGEVFVTYDGGETDLDIGHYERFLGSNLKRTSSISSGKIYQNVLNKERKGEYLGKTVQIIPHITNEIKENILKNAGEYDVLFVEIGGTVGDIESLPYLESIRQLMVEIPNDTFLIHASYVPYLKASKELKTKPTQHSVKELLSLGIRPNMIVTRNEIDLSQKEKNKIAMFCNVKLENVIESVDVKTVYEIPLLLKKQNIDNIIAQELGLNLKNSKHEKLNEVINKMKLQNKVVKIAIVGKYTALEDAYISVIEAVKHGAIVNGVNPKIELISAQAFQTKELDNFDGIIVAGGFGESGIEGKLNAIRYAREKNVPYLGICLGMQLAVLEFARNVCDIDVYHGELNPEKKNQIIGILQGQDLSQLGGTLRLGDYECKISEGTKAYEAYQTNVINERHRHRYEFNNEYRSILESRGMIFSGINPESDLVEIIENPSNDFFVATQFHPELTSKLTEPNKLFIKFIHAIAEK